MRQCRDWMSNCYPKDKCIERNSLPGTDDENWYIL